MGSGKSLLEPTILATCKDNDLISLGSMRIYSNQHKQIHHIPYLHKPRGPIRNLLLITATPVYVFHELVIFVGK